jgi:hypothetical protein
MTLAFTFDTVKMANSQGADMEVASIFLGAFLSLLFFTAVKALRQTWSIWKRIRDPWNWYSWMVWIEVIVNFVFSITTYMYIRGDIKPR